MDGLSLTQNRAHWIESSRVVLFHLYAPRRVRPDMPDILHFSRIGFAERVYEKVASKVARGSKLRIPKCGQPLLAGVAVTTHEKPPGRGVLQHRRGRFCWRSCATQCSALGSRFFLACFLRRRGSGRAPCHNQKTSLPSFNFYRHLLDWRRACGSWLAGAGLVHLHDLAPRHAMADAASNESTNCV